MKRLDEADAARGIVMTETLQCENCGGYVSLEAPVGASIRVYCPYCQQGSALPPDVQLRVGGTRIVKPSAS